MYIVNIEGSDPFISTTKKGIKAGLDDLHDGEIVSKSQSKYCVRILYKTNTGQELNIVADKAEVYK